jgi:hypothetical protein
LDSEASLDNREGASDEWKVARSAMMLRRRAYFEAMVDWAGGVVTDRALEMTSQFYQIIEVSAHIKKKP